MKIVRKIFGAILLCLVFGFIFLLMIAAFEVVKAIVALVAALLLSVIICFAVDLLFC